MFEEKIKTLFLRLMATQSDTNTLRENYIAEQILFWLKEQPYFEKYPHLCGTEPLADDPYQRNLVWALVKGKGKKTVVFIHHHDAIDIEEYGRLKSYALRPDELAEAFKKRILPESIKKDLESNEWIFGRGSADMKSGAAIQMVLCAHYSEKTDFDGNIVLLSVPDEESLSRGMLKGISKLAELRDTYALEYTLGINSEPYFNQVKEKAIFHEGSVGKIMPVLYVKGVKSHIGEPFSGFNPSLVLADLHRKTELNVELCDVYEKEATPPPVWVNLKDRKKAYDASIPEAATGYFNWLTFSRSPSQIMQKLVSISRRTMRDTLIHFQDAYENYCALTGETCEPIELNAQVLTFENIYQNALEQGGEDFLLLYQAHLEDLNLLIRENTVTLPEAATRIIEFVLDQIDLEGPAIIIALSGPYYPHVNNDFIQNKLSLNLLDQINAISKKQFGISYESKPFFMGISDLSYLTWSGNDADVECIRSNSPGWDCIYKIPFTALKSLSMPVLNLGPWGKDLHKITERVYAKDVYEVVPFVLNELIEGILNDKSSQ